MKAIGVVGWVEKELIRIARLQAGGRSEEMNKSGTIIETQN